MAAYPFRQSIKYLEQSTIKDRAHAQLTRHRMQRAGGPLIQRHSFDGNSMRRSKPPDSGSFDFTTYVWILEIGTGREHQVRSIADGSLRCPDHHQHIRAPLQRHQPGSGCEGRFADLRSFLTELLKFVEKGPFWAFFSFWQVELSVLESSGGRYRT